ncbi:uncharacterized protein LOC121927021 isoform X3 [Sceloporus undulatus]|uniref:uncharacterized protein LOC121927021 isoform X3 n=1 Tax=Sceloporus undulatus TaxID=8520 RepID=UPI001C4C1240|nr:uncharacterized protein LOC121927021 isoform X3 [Sceloporus undulatus]
MHFGAFIQLGTTALFLSFRMRVSKDFKMKRVCRSLEMICTSHPPSKCAVDFNAMEQDSSQDDPTEFLNPQIMKEKLNCTIFPHNETRAPVQPCPRCIAGEPTAFVHEEMRMYSQTNLDLREKAEGIWIFNNIRQ